MTFRYKLIYNTNKKKVSGNMKFIHMADMHFDIPFTTLGKKDLGNERRLDQREAFRKIIEYIKQNKIEYLFICGDLYEHEYVKQSTIEYINSLFLQIPETKIYITPGNHDPNVKNSFYRNFKFSNNVHIFGPEIEKISEEEVDIYGFGFDNFYKEKVDITKIKIENPNKINILLTHTELDATNKIEMQYNPISKRDLKKLGFDYIALGHIHKPSFEDEENQKIVYPGSTISLGFDELGKHGMIVGNIDENKKLEIAFVTVDKKEFVEKQLQVDELFSPEELVELLNNIPINENNYYKIILVGKRNFEIDLSKIEKLILKPNIVKIKDETKTKIDLEELSKKNTLKGIFVRNMLEQMNEQNRSTIEKAIEIGLETME